VWYPRTFSAWGMRKWEEIGVGGSIIVSSQRKLRQALFLSLSNWGLNGRSATMHACTERKKMRRFGKFISRTCRMMHHRRAVVKFQRGRWRWTSDNNICMRNDCDDQQHEITGSISQTVKHIGPNLFKMALETFHSHSITINDHILNCSTHVVKKDNQA